jgi:hypothetical protein
VGGWGERKCTRVVRNLVKAVFPGFGKGKQKWDGVIIMGKNKLKGIDLVRAVFKSLHKSLKLLLMVIWLPDRENKSRKGEIVMEKNNLEGTDLVRVVLRNLHDSLKWLWLVIMAFSLVNAIEVYTKQYNLQDLKNPFDLVKNMFFTEHTVVLISFIFIFIRFYFGNSRFLNVSYEETLYRRGLEIELDKYSGLKRTTDIMLLLSQGILVCIMSFYIGNSDYYSYFFVIFMVINVFWFLLQVFFNINARHQEPDPLIGNMKGQQVLVRWCANNFLFIILIICVISSECPIRTQIYIGLTILNSVIDFRLTWKYYFPPLLEIYNKRSS